MIANDFIRIGSSRETTTEIIPWFRNKESDVGVEKEKINTEVYCEHLFM